MNVLTICGSLRKGSYNAALVRALPALAPEGMRFTAAPRVDMMPHYNHDDQEASGFPASANAFAEVIRAADGVIIVSFTGAAAPEGPFIEIASLPGLLAGVKVVRDAAWWEHSLSGWEGVLKAMRERGLRVALDDPEVAAKLAANGAFARYMTPAEVTAFVQAEQRTWRPILQRVAAEAK